MDEILGNVTYESEPSPFLCPLTGSAEASVPYSLETAREIDTAVRSIIQAAFARATDILKRHRDVLVQAASLLLEHETLDAAQLEPFARRLGTGVVAVQSGTAD